MASEVQHKFQKLHTFDPNKADPECPGLFGVQEDANDGPEALPEQPRSEPLPHLQTHQALLLENASIRS